MIQTSINYSRPQNGVFILDVYTDGAAGKDGRLQPGDRILEINKENFKTMEQEKAYNSVMKNIQGPVSFFPKNTKDNKIKRKILSIQKCHNRQIRRQLPSPWELHL